ncbi:MAG TPA: OsmC family protein [Thermodesulfovibrionales bacterium]|nr:OsmC family protein [Thermodesulfovibrionales bacterium]
MDVRVKYTDGLQFIGETESGHAVVMDGEPEYGGKNTSVRPTELLLVGLGGCSGMDVVSVLKKKKQDVRGLEILIRGSRAEEHPKKFTDITIEFVVTGRRISEEAVKRAVDLSMEKYCSVKATLEGCVTITFSYRIVEG